MGQGSRREQTGKEKYFHTGHILSGIMLRPFTMFEIYIRSNVEVILIEVSTKISLCCKYINRND